MKPAPPNKLGIVDAARLRYIEADIASAAFAGITGGSKPLPGPHGIERLAAIHRYLFGELFHHAGTIRTTPLAKPHFDGGKEVTRFSHPALVRLELKQLFADLQEAGAFSGLGRLDFASKGAVFLARLNQTHPFEDGNGRTQRAYLQLLALDAGHILPCVGITQSRMSEASIRAGQGDTTQLRDMLEEQLTPSRRLALASAESFLRGLHGNELDAHSVLDDPAGKTVFRLLLAQRQERRALHLQGWPGQLFRREHRGSGRDAELRGSHWICREPDAVATAGT